MQYMVFDREHNPDKRDECGGKIVEKVPHAPSRYLWRGCLVKGPGSSTPLYPEAHPWMVPFEG
jgi:hypothetical protein